MTFNPWKTLCAVVAIAITICCMLACKNPNKKDKITSVTACIPVEPDKLNPLLSSSGYTDQLCTYIFQPMMTFSPENLELTPILAKSKPIIKDIKEGEYKGGVSLTYEIREEAKWDNGTPILASDYAFTTKVFLNPKIGSGHIRNFFDAIKDVKIDPDNPRKFTIYTNKSYFLIEAVTSNFLVYPAYVYDPTDIMSAFSVKDLADFEKANQLAEADDRLTTFANSFNESKHARERGFVVGSGPYELEEWVTGQKITLTKKKDWWGDKLANKNKFLNAFPNQLIFKITPDDITPISLLKNGTVDVAAEIPSDAFLDLKKNELVASQYNFHTPASMRYYYIGINGNKNKLADKKVRRALAHLVDVDHLIAEVLKGFGERTTNPVHPSRPYYNQSLKPMDYNPQKALSLFKEAGWTDTNNNGIVDKKINGSLIEMELDFLVYSGSDNSSNTAILFKDWASKGGVKINIRSKEFGLVVSDYKKRDYELVYGAWAQAPSPPDPQQIWHTKSNTPEGQNRTGFGDAASDAIIDNIRATIDPDKRAVYYKQLQEIIYEEQPYIFLYAPLERIAIHKRFDAKTSSLKPGYFPYLFSVSETAKVD